MKYKLGITLLSISVLFSCSNTVKTVGDTSLSVFENTNLYFSMDLASKSSESVDDIYRLDAGRVLLKKVKLPNYQKQPNVTVEMTLKSNGDAWDKSGSLFVIPTSSDLNLLDFTTGKFNLQQLNEKYPAVKSFQKNDSVYQPAVELIRFMTPFGVGHFSNDEKIDERRPVYIPKWENEVVWKQNITHLLPLLENEVYIGVYIDTWTKEGYNLSVDLNFDESKIENHIKKEQQVVPIVNTTKYAPCQGYYDAFSNGSLDVEINTDKTYKNAKLYYITTGHGGHSQGDEFVKKENVISLDGEVIKQFVPWRDDCASFRRFNPHSGVWMRETTWRGEPLKERQASSDLSRSNWCPGSDAAPEVIELGDLKEGSHKFEFSIPEAQAIDGDKINYWMVSAYIVYDEE